ncbi:MAG: hypothetical protein IIA73_09685, partial [Proteobacteria bacterium]|nr:hypothetical protein [Pseudomonadota bacterium]
MQRSAMDLGVEFDVWHTRHDRPGARSAGSRFVSAAVAGARSGRRLACALAVGALIVAGTLVTGPAYAQSFPKDYSETVYKSAYARILTRNPKSAVEPLRILMSADPDLAHVQNLLAVALLALNPAEPEVAFEHAKRAVAIDPDVPQFVVVHVLTDVRKTKIGKDRVARLTRAAARELSEAAGKLSGMKGNAKRLGKLLKEIKETGADPDFPFEFKGMKNIFKRPNAVLTHPDKGSFTVAQRVLEQKIRSRRQKLDRDKDQANEEQRQAQARQREIEQQVAAAAERQRRVEKAKSRALEKVEKAAIEAAANAKRVAEIDRQRKLMAEAEERRLADERRLEQKR